MTDKTLLTQAGYQQLTKELIDLKARRDRLIAQIEEVAQPDESGEDILAIQLKEELGVLIEKIELLQDTLESAKIITSSPPNSCIQIGSRIKIRVAGSTLREFHLVSHLESDPATNKISDKSPLGRALLGKKVNDLIEVEAPVGRLTYKVISIS
jgi:transcription elongation factor GreA